MFSFASKSRKYLVYINVMCLAHCCVPSSLLSFMKDHDSLVSIEDNYCFIKERSNVFLFSQQGDVHRLSRQLTLGTCSNCESFF